MIRKLNLPKVIIDLILDYVGGNKEYWQLVFTRAIISNKLCRNIYIYNDILDIVNNDLRIDNISDYYTKKGTYRLKCHISFRYNEYMDVLDIYKRISKYCNKAHNSKKIILIEDEYIKFIF